MTKASDNEFPSVLFDEQAGDPSTPASGFWRAYMKSDGLYVIDDAGSVTGPLGTGGGGTAELLAYKTYALGGSLTASTDTLIDADATNLAVTFTAPASTNVLVRLSGTMRVSAAVANRVLWGLREGTTVIAGGNGAGQFVGYVFTATVVILQATSVAFPVLGISGGSHTYKWAIGCTAASGGVFLDAANPATMEVWALP